MKKINQMEIQYVHSIHLKQMLVNKLSLKGKYSSILSCLILNRKKSDFRHLFMSNVLFSFIFPYIYIYISLSFLGLFHRILAKAFHLRRFGVFQFGPALRRRGSWPSAGALAVVVALAVLGSIGNEAHHVHWFQGEEP